MLAFKISHSRLLAGIKLSGDFQVRDAWKTGSGPFAPPRLARNASFAWEDMGDASSSNMPSFTGVNSLSCLTESPPGSSLILRAHLLSSLPLTSILSRCRSDRELPADKNIFHISQQSCSEVDTPQYLALLQASVDMAQSIRDLHVN